MNAVSGGPFTSVAAVTAPRIDITRAEMELADMAGAIWRGKWAVGALAALAAAAGLAWGLFGAEPRFRATAVVVLETGADPMLDMAQMLPLVTRDGTRVNTELEVLRSTALLSDIVEQEGLMRDPAFNPALAPPGALGRAEARLRDWLGRPAAPVAPAIAARSQRNGSIAALSAALTVRNVPDSHVFEITIDSHRPETAARLANAVAARYLDQQLETKFEATERASQWLGEKVAELEVELEQAEAQTNRFAAEMELISPETLTILSQQLKETRDRIDAWEAARDRGQPPADTASRIEQLRRLEAELSEKISRQSEDLVGLEQLQREAAASRQIYEFFLARFKETSVQQGVQQADARLLSPALIPDRPSAPRPVLLAALAGTLGALAAMALLIAREARTATFRTADDLEAATGLPVLGQVPRIPGRRRHAVLDHIRRKPRSAAVEAVRNLRTSLMTPARGEPPQVIACTSSVPGEGKTTLALALAQNLSGVAPRVLLIEGDTRKRVFRDYFDADPKGSLVRVTHGGQPLDEAVWTHPELGIDILFAAETPGNAADLLSSRGFKRLIRIARNRYDVIIIDTPPVLLVPDARIIGTLVDAVLYAVRWDRTRERQVAHGIKALTSMGVPVRGTVLSLVSPRGMRRYGYGADYGTYGGSGYYEA